MIHVLLISDDKALTREVEAALAEAHDPPIRLECLRPSKVRSYVQCDVCLIDVASCRGGRRGSLREFIPKLGGVPAIAVLESQTEEAAFKALKAGATDYMSRSDLSPSLLMHAIERAWVRMKIAEESGTYQGLRTRAEESEERYKTVVESIDQGMAVFDEAGLCHFINRASAARLEAIPEDLIGRTVWDLFPQHIADSQMEPVREVIRHGTPKVFEAKSIIRGRPRWYHTKIVPLREQRRGRAKALILAIDITETKQTQDALREREESARNFQTLLKKLQDVTISLSGSQSLDELCRRTVELARTELGCDRVGLWFLEEDGGAFRGSYGVDEAGNLRDERSERIPVAEGSPWAAIVSKEERVVIGHGPLQDNAGHVVGEGSSVFAGLWDGEKIIGVMTVDNLLTKQSMDPSRVELLVLYASAVGHLCSIRRQEDSAQEFLGRLMALHEISAMLVQTDSRDALFRQAIELGRERLGFDRLAIWLIAEEPHVLRGTFGTDEDGRLRDERERRHALPADKRWRSIFAKERIAAVQRNEALRDDAGQTVGQGDFASASLWDGDKVIGSMVADNMLSRKPMTESQCRLLTLYASTVGSLYSIRRGEEELQLFKRVIESSEEALAIHDREGAIVYVNRAHQNLFGRSLEDSVGKTLDDLYTAESLKVLHEKTVPPLARGETWEGELTVQDRSGRSFPLWQRVDSVRDTNGDLLYAFTIMHDISARKKVEEALRQSEERFRTEYKNFPIPTVTWRWMGQDFELTDYNDAMMALTHGAIGEFLGIKAEDLLGDEPDILAELRQCLRNKKTIWREMDKRLKFGQGVKRLSVTYVFAPPDSVMVHTEDITAREEAERGLRESEARYRELVSFMADVVWRVDMQGRFTYVNPTAKAMVGFEPEELIGELFEKVLTEESTARARESLMRRERGEIESEGIVLELTLRRKDGTEFVGETHSAVIRDTEGAVAGIQGITRNVTAQKEAEKALRESEERYRTLVEYSPDAIVVVDAETYRFVDANTNAEALFALSRQELLRAGPVELSPPTQPDGLSSAEAARARIRLALAGEASAFEWVHQNAAGEEVPCEVRLIRVPPANRLLVRASVTDITARKRAERTIAEQRAKMISASRLSSLGVMASGVAHEINNPLAIISGGAEQLDELVHANAIQRERVEKVTDSIRRNVGRIERIVRGLRNLSRDSAKDPFRSLPVKAIVDDALELCRARFRAHDIALDMTAIPDSVEVECRPTLVSQVILNLLNNSYDAVIGLPERWVRLRFQEFDAAVEITVTDSGEGIPPPLAEKVFEPFFSTKEVGRGTGLGLSISKGIIDSHHGALSVDLDSPNTSFVLQLPKRQPSPGSAE